MLLMISTLKHNQTQMKILSEALLTISNITIYSQIKNKEQMKCKTLEQVHLLVNSYHASTKGKHYYLQVMDQWC